ncbi:WD40-repeat-containing domain protein [Bisporella sp. PMI_857]|nr:WD40-repeat-containing domain protein [Bisporella sp. PMI_857]
MQFSNPPSSPPRSLIQEDGEAKGDGKPKGIPSITPRKFTRFFTPRSQAMSTSSSRVALENITSRDSSNRNSRDSSTSRGFGGSLPGQENDSSGFPRGLKRRKLYHTPESSRENAHEDIKYQDLGPVVSPEVGERQDDQHIPSSPCVRASKFVNTFGDREVPGEKKEQRPKPMRRLEDCGLSAQLLQLRISNAEPDLVAYPANDWQCETAGFHTRPLDVHMTTSIEGNNRVIPFCTASCNTNSLVAVGDEEGQVRLLESSKGGSPGFSQTFMSFRVHANAIIDMVFSEDDSLLATASGDQSARVVDMSTQTTLSKLGNHTASLKQVRFQPGANNNSVLATSSRDGCVQLWDLRCNTTKSPQQQFHAHIQGADEAAWSRPIHTLKDAHKQDFNTRMSISMYRNDEPTRGEVPGRLGDMSVTALSFLAQDNLLVTGSEADASIRLWDLRALHSKRKAQVPVSQTVTPQSHTSWRHFGISSINLGGDGSKLYSLCKDNTVYVYSTAHLILGHAPEMSSTSSAHRLPPKEAKEGLGPMYGYRHPQLHATSFYVKSAIRKEKDGKCEMLAVGSSDGCAVLFPTDERYLPKHTSQTAEDGAEYNARKCGIPRRPGLRRQGSLGLSRVEEDTSFSMNGTPLIRGHDREVGNLAWTSEGNLVTVGDDFLVRCWHDDGDGKDARDLRVHGEAEGRRWGCGWADVSAAFDDDDEY